jgi:hypothetical protein
MGLRKEKNHPVFVDGLRSYFIENMKRYSLKQKIARIGRKTGIFTHDFGLLCNALDRKINLSSYRDQ